MFHPVVEAWFARRFPSPTAAQARAWPAIARGEDTLIAAPTGSGKTLAAFLFCLDRLVRDAYDGALGDETSVLYVSPLKALSADVQKNLEQPLAEIAEVAASMGLAPPAIRTGLRTGDTPAAERQRAAKRPPHVLVTTPESLFLLLTSDSGRRALAGVRTVILDEIHAIAADKRGAHLALSVERVDDLVGGARRPQRIGLSATVRPIEVAARLLVGNARPMPVVVDVGQRRDLDLAVEVPRDELSAVATNEQWDELYDRLAALAKEHRSTLVFVSTRKLVERVAHHLESRLGEGAVAPHHGSLSRARRHLAEKRLKAGELRVVVATASLELGIDVGAVELTCLVGSVRSIAAALQRVGRSGHAVLATPKGRFFPMTRDQLLEHAAIVSAARRGTLDAIALRDAPLDVLAQQIVALGATEPRDEDALYELVRRAAPYASLTREQHDAVVAMLAEGIATGRGRAGALLHRDAVGRKLRARRGARLTALTSGGAIPDNANYDVVEEPHGALVGTIDEDFAVESMAGDVILLGNSSWRIRRVEMGKVRVEDARGAPPTIPFWLGEAPARTAELSAELGHVRERFAAGASVDALMDEHALCRRGAELARDYVLAGVASLSAAPTPTTVIAERFFDEAGGMQLVLHAPLGARVNRAWGLALRKRLCRTFDFELQAAATDDGVLLSLGPQHSFPLESVFDLVHPDSVRELLVQAALQAPMFGTRFRWNATRFLVLPRRTGDRRVPPPIQRMRSDDLLAAVFPAQQGCQDNHGVGAIVDPPDHPLVSETIRDCLVEVMDADGLSEILHKLRRGEIRKIARETAEPSVFSHEILNANPYAFLDDAPLEERRARAVIVRRGLPAEIAARVGGLDAAAIEATVAEARPEVRDAEELHELLLDRAAMPAREGVAAGWEALLDELARERRAARLETAEGAIEWVAAERIGVARALWPEAIARPDVTAPERSKGARVWEREQAAAELVRARLATTGPVSAGELAALVDLPEHDVTIALARVESEGAVLRGRFREGAGDDVLEWCDRRLLARIHRRTVDRLRAEIEPVTAAALVRFLIAWQGAREGSAAAGQAGLLRALEQLQGFEIAAGAWESDVLPLRVRDYDPAWLDALCLSGEIVWGRLAPRASAAGAPTRAAPITLLRRRDAGFLLATSTGTDDAELRDGARAVLAHLRAAGASFTDEIASDLGMPRGDVEEALAELVAAGRVTGDGFEGLRALVGASPEPPSAPIGLRGRFRPARARVVATGRWSVLRRPAAEPEGADDDAMDALARQYLRRYGVVFRDLLAREPRAPAWRDLVRVYRRLEMRGEIRGGRMVGGFVGEQFALPEALDALRALRREPARGEVVRVSACDPLNLVGIVTPGPRVPAAPGRFVMYRDGVPIPDDAAGAPADEARSHPKDARRSHGPDVATVP
jgi:ATP-dependent Lhr-like helicase